MPTITYYAWDQASGTATAQVDLTSRERGRHHDLQRPERYGVADRERRARTDRGHRLRSPAPISDADAGHHRQRHHQ